jgi:hypothetical protein
MVLAFARRPRLAPELSEQLQSLRAEARADDQMDRRGAARYPYFRPARLLPGTGELGEYTAFTRELATTGIGLLHSIALAPGSIIVVLHTQDGARVRLPTQLQWCRPCGDGWYVSGGTFEEG